MMQSRHKFLLAGATHALIALGVVCALLRSGLAAHWLPLPAEELEAAGDLLFFAWLSLLGAWLLLLLVPPSERRRRQQRQPHAARDTSTLPLWREPAPESRWLDSHHDLRDRTIEPAHAGVSHRQPAAAAAPQEWTLELLQELEWRRFEQLCTSMFSMHGLEARHQRRGTDHGLALHLYRRGGRECHAIAYCKSWHARRAGVDRIRVLYELMVQERIGRGCYLTNIRYSDEAREFATGIGLHLMDGPALLARIRALPARQQRLLLQLATSGDYRRPTCAACQREMVPQPCAGGALWRCSAYPACRHRALLPSQTPEFA
ncbi:MAG: restriction endonuclease [Burkholderiaceae bacterium]